MEKRKEVKNSVVGTNGQVEKEQGKEYSGEMTAAEYATLRAKYGTVITMVIPTDREFSGYAVGYFKRVDRPLLSAYLSMADEIDKKAMLLDAIFIGGDRRILDEDDLFFSACLEVERLVSFPKGVSVIF